MKPLESIFHSFVELHPDDAARAFETLQPDDAVRTFKSLTTAAATALLERLSPPVAAPILQQLDIERLRELLSKMPPRASAVVLQQLDEARQEEVLRGLTDAVARPLRTLARYPDDTAGAIMEPRVASLPIDVSAQQAIAVIRKTPREALHYLYVTQRDGKLTGVVTMRDLLLASPRDPLETLVNRNVLSIADTMDRAEVVSIMRERGFFALPVVDVEGRLIGVVKHGEVLEAGQLEAFEDMQRSVGAGADERALSPVSLVVRRRLPWLMVNLGTAFLAAAVVGMFEGIIARVAALAVLLPVVAGQSGNTGAQSVAVIMRGIALREIIPGTGRRVIVKELLGGLINGLAVAVVTSIAVYAWRAAQGDTRTGCVGMSLVIGLAMIVSMGSAALAGATIPILLRLLGRDPAQSATIFLTTVTDVVGFASFLGLATVLGGMLG